jgi:Protein of unknown function (DUF3478).
MLTIMQGLPDTVAGIHAQGNVTKDELDHILIPALDDLVARTGDIRYLLVLDTDLTNWDIGAWLSDAAVGIKHFTKWKKIAVVTDKTVVQKFTDLFSAVVPGDSKGFEMNELEEAKKWVAV